MKADVHGTKHAAHTPPRTHGFGRGHMLRRIRGTAALRSIPSKGREVFLLLQTRMLNVGATNHPPVAWAMLVSIVVDVDGRALCNPRSCVSSAVMCEHVLMPLGPAFWGSARGPWAVLWCVQVHAH